MQFADHSKNAIAEYADYKDEEQCINAERRAFSVKICSLTVALVDSVS